MTDNRNTSPVGWYIGSYLIRFTEPDSPGSNDPEAEFLVWENTVIVKAESFDEAFEKVRKIGLGTTIPYRGGEDAVPVQWIFEGITELLPVYEALEDGAEIMWQEHDAQRLDSLRKQVRSLDELKK